VSRPGKARDGKPPAASKGGVFGRVLDRVPLFGTFRRVKGAIRRRKGWIYLIVAVAILFIVRPVLTILAEVFKILAPMIRTLFDNPVGRIVFYNVLGALLLYWVWRKSRAGIARAFGLRAMRLFLDGMQAMILGQWGRAIRSFEKVVRIGRWVRLEDAVPEHRDIEADAKLKVAACHLELDRPNEAKSWLLRVREQDLLSDHVRGYRAELRALAYDRNDELEEETVLSELEKTRQSDRHSRRVLRALRDRLEARGELERTRQVARQLVEASTGLEKDEAARHLALVDFRLAHRALQAGDRKETVKTLKAQAGDVRAALMLGDLALERGDLAGALKAWSRAVSLPVFDRIGELLESGRLDGERERALLLSSFPYAGTMLVLAEHYRKRGEFRKARAAVEKVMEVAGENFHVLQLYAACLDGDGDAGAAADLYRRALAHSIDS